MSYFGAVEFVSAGASVNFSLLLLQQIDISHSADDSLYTEIL